jgi:hypothetical protein
MLHSLRYRQVCSVSFMYEDERDDRFEAAARLAEVDEAQAAEALRSIVANDTFDPDIRSEAAARLAEVDPAQTAAPFPGFAPRAPRGPRAPQAPRRW